MAELVLNVKINGVQQSVSTLGEVEQALRDTRAELEGVAIGSEAFQELTKQARNLQGQLEQVEKAINFEQSVNLLGESVGRLGATVASGFAVATSAVSLFFGESEELTEAQIKAQQTLNLVLGATTIATNLSRVGQDLKNISDALGLNLTRQKTAATTTNTVVTAANTTAQGANATATTAAAAATRGFTAALAANPIGLVLVAVTALVGAMALLGGETKDTFSIQEDYNEELDRSQRIISNQIAREKELIKVRGQLREAEASSPEEAFRIRLETQAALDDLTLQDIDSQIKAEQDKLEEVKKTYDAGLIYARSIYEKQKTLVDRNIIIEQDAATQKRIQIISAYDQGLISATAYYDAIFKFEDDLARRTKFDTQEERDEANERIKTRRNLVTNIGELEKQRRDTEKILDDQRKLAEKQEQDRRRDEAKREAERIKQERERTIEANQKELEQIKDATEANELELRKLRIETGQEIIRDGERVLGVKEALLKIEFDVEKQGIQESLTERIKEVEASKVLSKEKKDAIIADLTSAANAEIDSLDLLFQERRKAAKKEDDQVVLEAQERSAKLAEINRILQSEIRFGDQDTLDSFEALQIRRDELEAERLGRYVERQLAQEGVTLQEFEKSINERERLLISSLNRREQIELRALEAENRRNLTALAQQLESEFQLQTDFDTRVLAQVLAFTDEQAKIERDALLARQATLNDEERAYLALLQTRVNQTEETAIKTTEITQQYADQRVQIENEADDRILQKRLDTFNNIFNNLKSATAALRSEVTEPYFATLDVLQEGLNSFLTIQDQEFATVTEKVLAYTGAALQAVQGLLQAISQANQASLQQDLEAYRLAKQEETNILTEQYNRGLISKEQFDAGISAADKKFRDKELAAKKKAFEEDKKLKIAQAIIAGLQGAVSAFAGAMSLGPIAGPIVGGILAALVATLTGVQVAAIAATKFDSGPTQVNPPSTTGPDPGSALQQQAGSTGGFTQFNQALTGDPTGGGTPGSASGGMTDTRVYVLESDITATQRRVSIAESTATFG